MARLYEGARCLAVDAADRVVLAGPREIAIAADAREPTPVLSFAENAVTDITDCQLDGAENLYLGGVAASGAKIGEKPIAGPLRKRSRTSWLPSREIGFVARIAL